MADGGVRRVTRDRPRRRAEDRPLPYVARPLAYAGGAVLGGLLLLGAGLDAGLGSGLGAGLLRRRSRAPTDGTDDSTDDTSTDSSDSRVTQGSAQEEGRGPGGNGGLQVAVRDPVRPEEQSVQLVSPFGIPRASDSSGTVVGHPEGGQVVLRLTPFGEKLMASPVDVLEFMAQGPMQMTPPNQGCPAQLQAKITRFVAAEEKDCDQWSHFEWLPAFWAMCEGNDAFFTSLVQDCGIDTIPSFVPVDGNMQLETRPGIRHPLGDQLGGATHVFPVTISWKGKAHLLTITDGALRSQPVQLPRPLSDNPEMKEVAQAMAVVTTAESGAASEGRTSGGTTSWGSIKVFLLLLLVIAVSAGVSMSGIGDSASGLGTDHAFFGQGGDKTSYNTSGTPGGSSSGSGNASGAGKTSGQSFEDRRKTWDKANRKQYVENTWICDGKPSMVYKEGEACYRFREASQQDFSWK